jgi:predicted TIM-barrel fold metal-dependent hydrolase
MRLLSDDELRALEPAETAAFPGPVPTQIVSSDEYFPSPQSAEQRRVEARVKALGDELGGKRGLSRRAFFRTASGMTAAYVAMNEVFGRYFDASLAEAADRDMAADRAKGLAEQFVMDTHTHFLRDDTRLEGFVRQREAVGRAGWNPNLAGKPQTLEDLKFDNYFKEIFLDSDTKVALVSGAPSEVPQDWFLTNDMAVEARAKVNARLGARRLMAHAIFTPGYPGWLEEVDRAIAQLKPDSFKGYTIGDNTHKDKSQHPWRMDDEKLVYPAYEKMQRAGLVNVCVHKGLFPPSLDQRFPSLRPYCDVRDVGKAAKDWPGLNFIIYHGAYRFPGGGNPADALAQFDREGRVDWVTDLAEIPAKHGVGNVYADLGQLFAQTTVAQPRLTAALMGTLVRGMGADHVIWGTDAVWTGAPQWQIEGLRRLEIPEEMRKQHGFASLGAADGPVKRAILGENVARLYGFRREAELGKPGDRLAALKADYAAAGGGPSNLRYGYVLPSRA